jgi:hypothetical protein
MGGEPHRRREQLSRFLYLHCSSCSWLAMHPKMIVTTIGCDHNCYVCMQLKSNRAFQLALRARSSLDQAFDDVIDEGLKKRSAAALQSITSAYAGAKGAVMVSCEKSGLHYQPLLCHDTVHRATCMFLHDACVLCMAS